MIMKKLIIFGALLLITSLASAQECYESSILSPSPFMGNNGEIFKLADGSLWEIKYEYEYLYEYYPTVIICPSRGKLVIKGKTLNVAQVGSGKSTLKSQSGQATQRAASSRRSGRSDCESGHWVDSVSSDGQIVKLEDGSIWEVDPVDAIDSMLWLPTSDIIVCDGKLINTDDNETVSARRIR